MKGQNLRSRTQGHLQVPFVAAKVVEKLDFAIPKDANLAQLSHVAEQARSFLARRLNWVMESRVTADARGKQDGETRGLPPTKGILVRFGFPQLGLRIDGSGEPNTLEGTIVDGGQFAAEEVAGARLVRLGYGSVSFIWEKPERGMKCESDMREATSGTDVLVQLPGGDVLLISSYGNTEEIDNPPGKKIMIERTLDGNYAKQVCPVVLIMKAGSTDVGNQLDPQASAKILRDLVASHPDVMNHILVHQEWIADVITAEYY